MSLPSKVVPQDPAEQTKWMQAHLQKIDASKHIGDLVETVKHDYSSDLRWVFKRLEEAFGKREHAVTRGRPWKGAALPESILNASVGGDEVQVLQGNALQFAVRLRAPLALVRWCLASGFDPTHYNPQTQNTPLQNMAMTGQWEMMQLCHQGGFDLSLRILPEHYPDLDIKSPTGWLLGSTLLHRFCARFSKINNTDQALKVLEVLMDAGLDPREATMTGMRPLDLTKNSQARDLLRTRIAWLDHQALETTTHTTTAAHARTRL